MENLVSQAFAAFALKVRLTSKEDLRAQERLRLALKVIEGIDAVADCQPIGSLARSTAATEFFDIDLIANLRLTAHGELVPRVALENLAVDIRKGDGYKLEIGATALTLVFSDAPSVDVVPGLLREAPLKSKRSFLIPTDDGLHWQEFDPDLQLQDLNRATGMAGPLLKDVIRIVKWWNGSKDVALKPFDIETTAIEQFKRQIHSYPAAVQDLLERLQERSRAATTERPMARANPPVGVLALDAAVKVAREAVDRGLGTHRSQLRALNMWRRLFGARFPDGSS